MATTSKQPTKQQQTASMIDELADDATPPALPDDAPDMTSYLKLPYRVRGDFMKKMKIIQEMAPSPETGKKAAEEGTVDADQAGDYFYLLAEIEELLHLVCDPAALAAWQAKHDDTEFVKLYNSYMRWSQAGEASSSDS